MRSRSAIQVQAAVIHALLMREILTRYGRHNIGFLWLFVEPMIFTLAVTVLWSLTGMHKHSAIPIAAFAVTGYSSVLLWRNMPARCVGALEPNLTLLYHKQVRVIDIFLSRLLLEAAGATGSFLVLTALFWASDLIPPPQDMAKVLSAWFLLAWFGIALAIFLGAASIHSELVDKMWHPLAYILFPLSGAAFMVDWLPASAQRVVLWIPTVHGVEFLRDGYFGSRITTHYSLAYMAAVCLALTALALGMERKASRRALV